MNFYEKMILLPIIFYKGDLFINKLITFIYNIMNIVCNLYIIICSNTI